MKKYDIIVIGAGSGGLNIAGFMRWAGFKTLLIDNSDKNIGGDCLNYGCVPSKALIHVSRLIDSAREAKRFGVNTLGRVDIKKVMGYVKSKQDIIRKHENAPYLRKKGMDVALGKVEFISSNKISVDNEIYHAKKIVIATGSRPRELDVPGFDMVKSYTNETIFDIDRLPKNLLVIGGGPIGIELGQAFQRLGSKVTVVHRGSSFLNKEDPKVAEVLKRKLESEGMCILLKCTPEKFTSSKEVILKSLGRKMKMRFDAVLVSIGRVINIDRLSLENAGIDIEGGRLIVDDYLRTTNKDVYVCGDAAGSFQFTHAAELQAGVIINNLFNPIKKKVDYDNLSWVTYTSPEIATFGLDQDELKRRDIKFDRLELDFKDDDRSIVNDYTEGKLIVYVSKDRIVGGTMIAMGAGELFQELVLANSKGLKIKDIFNKIYAYPTASRVNKQIIKNYLAKRAEGSKKFLHWMYGR